MPIPFSVTDRVSHRSARASRWLRGPLTTHVCAAEVTTLSMLLGRVAKDPDLGMMAVCIVGRRVLWQFALWADASRYHKLYRSCKHGRPALRKANISLGVCPRSSAARLISRTDACNVYSTCQKYAICPCPRVCIASLLVYISAHIQHHRQHHHQSPRDLKQNHHPRPNYPHRTHRAALLAAPAVVATSSHC